MSADRRIDQEEKLPKYENKKSQENLILPSYLSSKNGRFVFNQNYVIEGGKGEYDIVWDFGTSRDNLRLEVPVIERVTANKRGDMKFLVFNDLSIGGNMSMITKIANDPDKSYDNSVDREEYRRHLGNVYRSLADEVKGELRGDKALFFAPKNGGIYVQEIFTKEGINPGDFYDYRMSRVLATDKDGRRHLNVAAGFASNNPEISDYETFVVADDCLASDISCFATLDHISSGLREKGIDPSCARVIISVSAATQRGLESLLSDSVKKGFGFGETKAVAAIPVYKMTNEFYLQELDGGYTVGDMGKWTLKP